jgi:hypothetical protein
MNDTKLVKLADSGIFVAAVLFVGTKYAVLPLARKFKKTIDES